MNTIGIRIKPFEVTFAVFDSSKNCIVNVEAICIPKALSVPEALKYLRNTVLDIIREYCIKRAGIRVTESNAQTLSIFRIESEGVIQEAFASSTLESYFRGQISTLTAKLNIPRTDFKLLVDGTKTYESVEGWNEYSDLEKEAILTAIAAVV